MNLGMMCIVADDSCHGIVSALNELTYHHDDINLRMFTFGYNTENILKNFPVLPIHEAKYCYDTLITWDVLSIDLAINFPNIKHIFYIHNDNVAWTKNYNINYELWEKIFDNPKIDVITCNKDVDTLLQLTWKKPLYIEALTPENIYNVIR